VLFALLALLLAAWRRRQRSAHASPG
jgi:MYXO-CTERM domain-containing protein